MIGTLALLWLLTQSGSGSPTPMSQRPAPPPRWPGRQHPPPSKLPAPPSPPAPPAPARDAAPPPPTPVKVEPVPEQAKPATGRTPQQAARALYDYVRKAIANKQGALLGTKTRPNPFVRDAQRDMGIAKPDGIYGPATRTRGAQLLKTNFPARVSGEDRPLYIP